MGKAIAQKVINAAGNGGLLFGNVHQFLVQGFIVIVPVSFVNEDFVEPTIAAIAKGAHTGDVGDGKIFVVDLAECIRISSGERGGVAIGWFSKTVGVDFQSTPAKLTV